MPRRDPVHAFLRGALAQLGERLICIQEVNGSIPLGSTKRFWIDDFGFLIQSKIQNRQSKIEKSSLTNEVITQHEAITPGEERDDQKMITL